jgi:hypothetical protein
MPPRSKRNLIVTVIALILIIAASSSALYSKFLWFGSSKKQTPTVLKKEKLDLKKEKIKVEKPKARYKNLLFRVEYRDINKDRIIEYRFFNTSEVEISVLHDPGKYNPKFTTYNTVLKPVSQANFTQVNNIASSLKTFNYKNYYPWKEDYDERGNVLKIETIQNIQPEVFAKNQNPENINVVKVFYYYTGHQDAPVLFRQIDDLIGLI